MVRRDLSLATMHRIIKKAGAERVSESATEELAETLEKVGLRIGNVALELAMQAGRKAVRKRRKDCGKETNKLISNQTQRRSILVMTRL